MKLTVQVKLVPDATQAEALKLTMETANEAANRLSQLAWDAKEFHQFSLHRLFYRQIRTEFSALASQIVVRLNAKVADAYKLDQDTLRFFRKHGSISYDCRILAIYVTKSEVSIWTVNGRQQMPFVCDDRARKLLELPKGESDLIYKDLQWFLNVSVNVPEAREQQATEWLGIDLGLAKIATDSNGKTYGDAPKVAGLRNRRWRQRKRLQSKGTRSAKRVLRRLSGRESRFIHHTNHVISKSICAEAKRTGAGIAIEDLKGIRARIRARKSHRRTLHSWAFDDLRQKITYKCRLFGIPFKLVDPRNTSRRCPACGHTSQKNRKTQADFACVSCGYTANADTNAASNIARLASIDRPHERKGCKV